MELKQVIYGRRSVRAYDDREISAEVIKEIIKDATTAPSGSNMQPWAFVVVEDKKLMKEWSDTTKKILLGKMDKNKYLQQYKDTLENESFNIFYDAPCLLLTYGNTASPNYVFDCSMVALTAMLSAYNRGLGSCWVGFSMFLCNSPQVKELLGVPEEYKLVSPMVLGYPKGTWPVIPRQEPTIFSWKK
ncbi:MAG TPA: nitroreductase [Clostridia bacterium]|nr:nitroreductase [Clostridia bacterium]